MKPRVDWLWIVAALLAGAVLPWGWCEARADRKIRAVIIASESKEAALGRQLAEARGAAEYGRQTWSRLLREGLAEFDRKTGELRLLDPDGILFNLRPAPTPIESDPGALPGAVPLPSPTPRKARS